MATVGTERIAQERTRQIEIHGWMPEHDAKHINGELMQVAACYANLAAEQERREAKGESAVVDRHLYMEPFRTGMWPAGWAHHWWNPSDAPVRNMAKAGALAAAAIDRRLRAASSVGAGHTCPCKAAERAAADTAQAERAEGPEPRSIATVLADILDLRHEHDEDLRYEDMMPDELAAEARQAIQQFREHKDVYSKDLWRCGICGKTRSEDVEPVADAACGNCCPEHFAEDRASEG